MLVFMHKYCLSTLSVEHFLLLGVAFSGSVFHLQKYEELLNNVNKAAYSCLQRGEGVTGAMARPPLCSVGHQAEAQSGLRRWPPLQETGTDKGIGFGFHLANCVSLI